MLWPDTYRRDEAGAIEIGGCSANDLTREFGTPLYVYDEATLRGQARRLRDAFAEAYPNSRIVYAGKALLSPAVVAILHEEGIGLDVVSGGELYAGLAAGVPTSRMTFHGNNKGIDELREAIAAGVGLIAIDNLPEIGIVSRLAVEAGATVDCLLRLNPGIDTHTHDKIRTGHLDSKFGLPIATGDAERAVGAVVAAPGLRLRGYHAHVGSQLFDSAAYSMAVETLLTFAAEMRDRHGVEPEVISPGGGFGIAYEADQEAAPVERWAAETAAVVRDGCARFGLPEPELVIEPGRALVGRAGVALYTVGTIKHIPGVRTFVSVDGGMADNIRPTLYGAAYHVELASRVDDAGEVAAVTIAGKYCESGDILIDRATLPPLVAGDLLALPATGAYCLAMASNYNLAPRPAVVMVSQGVARLIRRRESYADLLRNDLLPTAPTGVLAGR
jgi:diaminopimelate decarboxylase